MKKDRRKINEVWCYKPEGQRTYYVFGRLGSGKNKTIVTLGHGSSKKIAWKRAKEHPLYKR